MIPSSGQSLRYYLRYRKVDSGIVNNSFISSFVFEQGRNNSGRRKNNNSPQYNSFPPPNSSRFYSSIRPISVQSKASKWGRLSSSLPTVFRSPSSSSSSFIPSLSSTDSKNDSNNDSFYSKSSFTAAIIILLASSQDSWLYSDSSSGEDRDKFGLASIYSNTGSKFNTVSAWEPIPAPLQQSSPSSSSSSSSSSLLSSLTGGNTNTSHTYHNHGSSSSSSSVADMIANVFPALCKIQGAVLDNTGVHQLGGGSGFVISEDGIIVTNDHVFQAMAQARANEVQAMFDDGRVYRIEPLAADAEADIAIGRIIAPPGTKFRALKIGRSDSLRRGDTIAVLGAPLGGSLVPAVGVLGGTRYVADDEVMNYVLNSRADWCLLQVDANMSSGSSGGPIVNGNGEVIGVSVMVQTAGTLGVGNLNYGVAIDQAYPIIRELLNKGTVTRAAIGMTIVLIDRLANERELHSSGINYLPPQQNDYLTGLLVTYTVPNKPAEQAGVREGDVILEINGRKMTRKGDYFAALGPVYEPGKELVCKVWRPYTSNTGKLTTQGRGGQIVTTAIKPVIRDTSPNLNGTTRRRLGSWHR